MNHQIIMTDEKLIQYYLNGDPNAMATLVELYKDRVYRSIYNLVQDKHKAEEIFQEVFICLINNMIAGKITEEGNFLQWASKIAQNLCVEYTRTTKVAELVDSADDETPRLSKPVTIPTIRYHESHSKIKSMIDLLPENQRQVMMLNHYGGLGFNEISGIMKCSLTYALDNMKFALNNLRKMMQEKQMILN